MNTVTVAVVSKEPQIHTLIVLASLFDGFWWYTSYIPEEGFLWQFDFPDVARAQTFMTRVPLDCIAALPDRSQAQAED